jgi:hypothetical protein
MWRIARVSSGFTITAVAAKALATGADRYSTVSTSGHSAAEEAIRSQRGSPCTVDGATRRLGWSSQSISLERTASVPVKNTKLTKIASFSPTHWCTCHQTRLVFLRFAGRGGEAAIVAIAARANSPLRGTPSAARPGSARRGR